MLDCSSTLARTRMSGWSMRKYWSCNPFIFPDVAYSCHHSARINPRLWETLCRRTCAVRAPIAKNWLFEPYGACSLLVLTSMHLLETLLIVLHENQWEDTLFQGSPELFSPSVKRRALGSRLDLATLLVYITASGRWFFLIFCMLD